MTSTAYRIVQTKYASTAFDGEGARLNGGRWNSVGTRMIYTSSSLSLATLEILVHLEDISAIYGRFTVIPIAFDSALVRRVSSGELPKGWDNPVPSTGSQLYGNAWIKGMSSVLLEVPSAVTENENNFLINPAHPEFAEISIGASFVFRPDPRLGPGAK